MTRRKSLASREPSGKVRRPPRGAAPAELMSPTEFKRLVDAAGDGLKDAVWGTPLGRLLNDRKITSTQFAAGVRWATLAHDYSAATQSPKAPRSANLDPAGGQSPDPDSDRGRREAQRHTHTKHQYLAALAVLQHTGDSARRAMVDVCELGQMPAGHWALASLRLGLDVLSVFWSERRR